MKNNKNKTTKGKANTSYTSVRKGVYRTPSGTYRARFTMNGTRYSRSFKTIKAAELWRNTCLTTGKVVIG